MQFNQNEVQQQQSFKRAALSRRGAGLRRILERHFGEGNRVQPITVKFIVERWLKRTSSLVAVLSAIALAVLPLGGAFAQMVPEITASNWYWAPGNRWSYEHTRRIFPSEEISRGVGPVAPLEYDPRELDRLKFVDPGTGKEVTIEKMYQDTFTDAYLVLKNGKIVTERYFHGMTATDQHLLMSVTKSVVGVLAGIVVEEGRLNLDALVTSYVPEVQGTIYEGATIRNVLDMSVAFDETRDDFDRLDEAAGWLPRRADSVDGLHAYLKTLTRKTGQHGEAFRYASENTDLMGWILERATGMDFAALMSKELWSKMGAERDAYILLDKFQTAYTDCGMNVTLRDLGRFAEMMMQNGVSNGRRIVSDEWIQDIRLNGDAKAWKRSPGYARWSKYKSYQNGSYRSYWYVSDSPVGRYMAIGLAGQLIVIDPSTSTIVIKFSSGPSPEHDVYVESYAGAVAIIDALADRSPLAAPEMGK